MSKNKRVVVVSVGILCLLIASVMFLRSPTSTSSPKPAQQAVVESAIPAPASKEPKQYDESHDKVAKIIDSASTLAVESSPGMWSRVVDAWNWFMAFDTKHALILIGFCLLVIMSIAGKKKSSNK